MSSNPHWKIDSTHSAIAFSVRHLMIAKVHGRFTRWNAAVEIDDADLTRSKVEVLIDASSIDTSEPKRDEHLRSADFLNSANFPEITYESSRVERVSEGRYEVFGKLAIRGIAREVVLDVTHTGWIQDPWGNKRGAFTVETSFDRRDFGLTWNMALEAGGVVVGERVSVEIEAEVVRQVAAAA